MAVTRLNCRAARARLVVIGAPTTRVCSELYRRNCGPKFADRDHPVTSSGNARHAHNPTATPIAPITTPRVAPCNTFARLRWAAMSSLGHDDLVILGQDQGTPMSTMSLSNTVAPPELSAAVDSFTGTWGPTPIPPAAEPDMVPATLFVRVTGPVRLYRHPPGACLLTTPQAAAPRWLRSFTVRFRTKNREVRRKHGCSWACAAAGAFEAVERDRSWTGFRWPACGWASAGEAAGTGAA